MFDFDWSVCYCKPSNVSKTIKISPYICWLFLLLRKIVWLMLIRPFFNSCCRFFSQGVKQFGSRSGPMFCSVGPDLGTSCFQRLSVDEKVITSQEI